MEWKNTLKAFDNVGDWVIEEFRRKLNQADPYSSNASYTLYNSVNYRVVVDFNSIKLLFQAPDDYYGNQGKMFLETGRKAGSKTPPIDIIEKWVLDKNINFGGYNVNQMAFLISRSIARDGVRPKPYLQEIRSELISGAQVQMIKDAMKEDIKNSIKV